MSHLAVAIVSAATGAVVAYIFLRRRPVPVSGCAESSRAAKEPSVVDVSVARLKRLSSAGFTTPLDRRVVDGVCIISLGGAGEQAHQWGTKACEHRLYPAAVLALDEALDAAENDESVRAIIITAEGKYFCNGFDLKFLQARMEMADDVQRATEKLCARVLRFCKPTVAAVNGHACAAGAMLMLCFDEVVMNSERGYCFVPGIDLGLTYSPGMAALMAARLPFALRHAFIVMGERLTAPQLAAHHVVQSAPARLVLETAVARAAALKTKATHGATMRAIKSTLYHEAIAALEVEPDAVMFNPTFVPMGFGNVAVGTDRPHAASKRRPAPSPRAGTPLKSRVPSSDNLASLPSMDALKQEALVSASVQAAQDLQEWCKPASTKG